MDDRGTLELCQAVIESAAIDYRKQVLRFLREPEAEHQVIRMERFFREQEWFDLFGAGHINNIAALKRVRRNILDEMRTNGKHTAEELQRVKNLFEKYPTGGADGK